MTILPRADAGPFLEAYTQGLTAQEVERLFTREAPEAYRFFSRTIDHQSLRGLPCHRRALQYIQQLFLAFAMTLAPARRAAYGAALLSAAIGVLELFHEMHAVAMPHAAAGTLWLLGGFALVNLLMLVEVADRLSLKHDLDVARGIQQAMLPVADVRCVGLDGFGATRPANTVGGDFYDIRPLPDGRVLLALGDVAGKGSSAALLMALLLAMMRTLVDEGLEGAALASRLNAQVCRYAPGSRFVTLFVATFDPATGALTYVNAGQNPPLVHRRAGEYDRLRTGGLALGMFEEAVYAEASTVLLPGDTLLLFSDGIPEAEDAWGNPFDESGLERLVESRRWNSARELGSAVLAAVEHHSAERRLLDDLTVLVARAA